MNVAVLGLGAMGTAVARRLEAAGLALVVHNRSPGAEPRSSRSAGRAGYRRPGRGEAAERADVCVITMLADGRAVESGADSATGAR